ncbi:hypothetical protein ABFA07_003700 [Porites harrisoni]
MERDGCASKVNLLLLHLPELVKDFTWEVQNEFGKCLNPLKETGCDWRIVASRLQLTWIIQRLEQKPNPTVEMLRECTETTSKELLEILVGVRRTDVVDDILKFVVKNARLLGPRHPTQESVAGDSSFDSSLSWPLQDSGKASSEMDSDISKLKLGPSESEETGENFLSDESEKFWLNIPGDYDRKSWTNFSQAARNCCQQEMQQGNVEKFLCKVLHIEYAQVADSHVRLEHFLALVALFGPFMPGPDGCLQKMHDLMKNSTSVREGTRESWFAGHMNETEAANFLEDQSRGSFLVRISSSRAHEGVFVLAVKTSNNGVVQIQIEKDLQDDKLKLADQKFPDLLAVVSDLRRNVLLENCRQLLINPCPRLPLNAIFSGYTGGGAKRSGRGRVSRGRDKSQR